jgi:hypothetical protein
MYLAIIALAFLIQREILSCHRTRREQSSVTLRRELFCSAKNTPPANEVSFAAVADPLSLPLSGMGSQMSGA